MSRAADSRTWATPPAAPPTSRRLDGLHRVHDEQVGLGLGGRGDDGVDVALRRQQHSIPDDSEPPSAQADLVEGLFGAGDQHPPPLCGERCRHLEEKRRLAHPRLAAEEDGRPGDQATTQHPIDLTDAHRAPDHLSRTGFAHGDHPGPSRFLAAPGAAFGGHLDERPVCLALGAESHPLGALVGADLAAVLHEIETIAAV